MTLKNFKLQILFSGFLTLVSITVSGQYLRKNMITAQVNVGFLQQERNICYQYSFPRFSSHEFKERRNQLFFGIEVGETNLRYSLFGGTSTISKGAFLMNAKGNHISFLLTNMITKPKKNVKKGFKYNYITLKCAINKFSEVKSYPDFDPYDEDDDFNPPPEKWITGEKCKSVNFELHLGKHIKLNSYNYFKVGIYGGFRLGNTTGIEHSKALGSTNGVEESYKFSKNLNPIILGLSLGYQINLGKQNTK